MCEFLENREMISKLNLRRNHISNQGAKCLGKFISEFDETLTHLDSFDQDSLLRNRYEKFRMMGVFLENAGSL